MFPNPVLQAGAAAEHRNAAGFAGKAELNPVPLLSESLDQHLLLHASPETSVLSKAGHELPFQSQSELLIGVKSVLASPDLQTGLWGARRQTRAQVQPPRLETSG